MKSWDVDKRRKGYLDGKTADTSVRKDRNTHPLQVFRVSGASAFKLWLSVLPTLLGAALLLVLHFCVPFFSENSQYFWYVAIAVIALVALCWIIQIWQILQAMAIKIIVYENAIAFQTGIVLHKYSSRRFTGVYEVCDFYDKMRLSIFDPLFWYAGYRHFIGWCFDFQDIYMDCPGGQGERLVFKGVAHPKAFKNYFLDKRRVAEDDAVSITYSR